MDLNRVRRWLDFPPPPPIVPYPGHQIVEAIAPPLSHSIALTGYDWRELSEALNLETGLYWQGWQIERQRTESAHHVTAIVMVALQVVLLAVTATNGSPWWAVTQTGIIALTAATCLRAARRERLHTIDLQRDICTLKEVRVASEPVDVLH